MNNVIGQLQEIFPSVDEVILKGICDICTNLDIEQLIEVVLSSEFLPRRESLRHCDPPGEQAENKTISNFPVQVLLGSSNDFPTENKIVTILPCVDKVSTENEVFLGSSTANKNLSDQNKNRCMNIVDDINHIENHHDVKSIDLKETKISSAMVMDTFSEVIVTTSVGNVSSCQIDKPCGSKKGNQNGASASLEQQGISNLQSKIPIRMSSSPDSLEDYKSTQWCSSQTLYHSNTVMNNTKILGLELVHKTAQNNSSSSLQFDDSQSKFSLLSKILTDANPAYLHVQSQLLTGQDELLNFISESLDNRDYPKIKDNEQKKSKQIMGRFDCSIEDFLQEIPDPVSMFSSDDYIRASYEENAEMYLKLRYQGVSVEVIKDCLKKNNYNLVKVCEQLEAERHEVNHYCLENLVLHHAPSVFFHQEVWYIEHKDEVQNYLKSVIEAAKVDMELNRPPTPPVVEEVFECDICSEEVVDYTELGCCDGSVCHLFCKNCIRRNTEVKIGEGATSFPCLANCGSQIPLQTIEEVLPAQMYSVLMNKIQEAEVRAANISGVESCPFCHFAYGPNPEAMLFICENPSCMKKSCRACRKEDHSPDECDILKSENEETARHFIENRMTEALVRQCYRCGKQFVKADGCNKMTCTCGAMMCYVCRKPATNYSHFNNSRRVLNNRCPLYADDETVHGRPVAASVRRAFDELVANNPGISIDINKIIPK